MTEISKPSGLAGTAIAESGQRSAEDAYWARLLCIAALLEEPPMMPTGPPTADEARESPDASAG